MTTLHLIVHRANLEKRLQHVSPERRKHLESVLDRIKSIIENEEPVKEFEDPFLYRALRLCEGYSNVILYGFTRSICLEIISGYLHSGGYAVSWDTAGTA